MEEVQYGSSWHQLNERTKACRVELIKWKGSSGLNSSKNIKSLKSKIIEAQQQVVNAVIRQLEVELVKEVRNEEDF